MAKTLVPRGLTHPTGRSWEPLGLQATTATGVTHHALSVKVSFNQGKVITKNEENRLDYLNCSDNFRSVTTTPPPQKKTLKKHPTTL